MTKITSLKINQGFEDQGGRCGECTTPYANPTFPVGHTIPTNSYSVFLLGRNGTGKTTLLEKMAQQFPDRDRNYNKDRFFQPTYKGEYPVCNLIRRTEKETMMDMSREAGEDLIEKVSKVLEEIEKKNGRLALRENIVTGNLIRERLFKEEAQRRDYLRRMSSGQTQMIYLQGVFAEAASKGENHILLLDEPETAMDIVNRRIVQGWVADRVRNNLQTFVATHDTDFYRNAPQGSMIIQLGSEEPAESIPIEDFAIERYMEIELSKSAQSCVGDKI